MSREIKTVCVTGASRGLGKTTAEFFFKSGWKIAIIARNGEILRKTAETLCEKYSRKSADILIIAADLALPETPKYCVDMMKRDWPTLDALVNNAGIQGPIGPFCEIDADDWENAFKTLLFAPLSMCRHVIPWMVSTGGGDIVNLSGGGAAGPRANFTAYAAAKTALVRTTEILALEYARQNVTLNAVAPGAMPTALLSEITAAGPEAAGEREYEAAQKSFHDKDSNNAQERAAECIFALCNQTPPKISGKLLSAVWDPWKRLESYASILSSSDIYTLRRIIPKDRGQNWEE